MSENVKNDRHNLKPKTLRDLQVSLYDWQNYNFGEQDKERTLVGICEEAGELCHAHLKGAQGIRGTQSEFEEQMRDAVGDIMIYTLNYMSGNGQKVPAFVRNDTIEPTDNDVQIRRAVLMVFRLVGRVAEDPTMTRIRHLISGLLGLCALKGWDLEEITRDTWSTIGQRDWKRYPHTGLPQAVSPETPQ